jgi:hypothetical protein
MELNRNIFLIKNFSYEEYLKIKEYLYNFFNTFNFILDYFPENENITLNETINDAIEEFSFFPQEQRLDYFLKSSDNTKESFVLIYLINQDDILKIIKSFPLKKEKKIIFFTLTKQNLLWDLNRLFKHLKEEYLNSKS